MQTLTECIIQNGLKNSLFTETQLAHMLDGSQQRRYHLVNRALKAGELVRLYRGVYTLCESLRDAPAQPFAIAQMIEPGSYISLETALAYYGWRSDTIETTTSIVPSRKSKSLQHAVFGRFEFHPLAIEHDCFFHLVHRQTYEGKTIHIAKPLRALMDLICLRKYSWQSLAWLSDEIRIKDHCLQSINSAEIRGLQSVYKQKRMHDFLDELSAALGIDIRL